MADTTTTTYGYTKPEVGASDDTWGGKLNANWDALDADLVALDAAKAVVDGDVLDITFTPSQYTPDSSPVEAADLNDLAAHLKGIDTALGGKSATGHTHSYLANVVEDTTPQLGGALDANSHTVGMAKGADVASAAELLVLQGGNYFKVTGTIAITSIETTADAFEIGSVIWLEFAGALTFTHHATNLILPGGANITTAAGDVATMVKIAAGDWRCVNYMVAASAPGGAAAALTESYDSGSQTVTAQGSLTLAHGLSATPTLITATLKCTTAELGYSIGDEVPIPINGMIDGPHRGVTIVPDSTNLNVRFGNHSAVWNIIRMDNGNSSDTNGSYWDIVFRAYV